MTLQQFSLRKGLKKARLCCPSTKRNSFGVFLRETILVKKIWLLFSIFCEPRTLYSTNKRILDIPKKQKFYRCPNYERTKKRNGKRNALHWEKRTKKPDDTNQGLQATFFLSFSPSRRNSYFMESLAFIFTSKYYLKNNKETLLSAVRKLYRDIV